jgi:hypothetical protein
MSTRKHCTMAELLAVRDGEGTAWAQVHADECPYCRQELDLIYRRVSALRALPAHRPPRDRWDVIREQAARERRRRSVKRWGWNALAAAAGIALLIGVRTIAVPTAGERESAELQSLITQSRTLEAALRSYDPDSRVLSGRAAGIIADLEDQIAVVDAGIAQADQERVPRTELVNLWRDRVDLMDALVNVHVTRANYVGF